MCVCFISSHTQKIKLNIGQYYKTEMQLIKYRLSKILRILKREIFICLETNLLFYDNGNIGYTGLSWQLVSSCYIPNLIELVQSLLKCLFFIFTYNTNINCLFFIFKAFIMSGDKNCN